MSSSRAANNIADKEDFGGCIVDNQDKVTDIITKAFVRGWVVRLAVRCLVHHRHRHSNISQKIDDERGQRIMTKSEDCSS